MKKRTALLLWAFMLPMFLHAQNFIIQGLVIEEGTNEPLISASVLLKGTTQGTTTDVNGRFRLEVTLENRDSLVLVVSFIGYQRQEIVLKPPFHEVRISMPSMVIPGQAVVISASRISESIMESPVQIQKLSAQEIRTAASGDFYQSLGNFKDVDIVTSSIGFKVFNTRGFNTTAPVRTVQFIDGMDNQAPGLNFPVGNLVGANDLDLASVEVISGAASALYGPNAFQGVVSMTSKNPFDYQGLSIQLKGGSRNYVDVQGRYAHAFGEKQRFALKFTGSYMRVDDWEATHPEVNVYGDFTTTQNLTTILFDLYNNPETPQEDRDRYERLLTGYLDFNPVANPGKQEITAPGYREADLADYTSSSLKFGAGAHYRLTPNLELSYNYRFGNGTAIYQGTNRYSINGIRFQQHKAELKGSNFFIRAYTTLENAGNSYDMVFTGINISRAAVPDYISEYLSTYFSVLDTLTNGFDRDARQWMADSARIRAMSIASQVWYEPGSPAFDSLFREITSNPDLQTGSQFLDKSFLQHGEFQYNITQWKWMDIIAGANVRRYRPRSFGTIFSDTLVNRADTLPNGRNDPNAEYVKISNMEYGGYVQATKKLWNDRLKLIASIRMDKNQNFELQTSPRGSLVFTQKNHNIRISGQSAFRSPTLQNQFIQLNLGPITLLGNTTGFSNLYTLQSVQNFEDVYESTFDIRPELLEKIEIQPVQPEQVRTLEGGYRGTFWNKLYMDVSAYFNWYSNFIGDIRVARPLGDAVAGSESGEDAIITGNYELFQIPVNAQQTVRTYGASVGLSYYIGKGLTANGNYTFSDINTNDLTDPIIPGFNTARHKFNIGLQGKKVWKGLGFNTNLKWVDSFFWESPFADGRVPSFYILDANINYELKKYYSTLMVGATNLTQNKHIQAFGGPTIGRLIYASILFEMPNW